MIRHCVFAKFRPHTPAAERDAIRAELSALVPLINGMGPVLFGPNVSPEPFARGYDFGFTVDFSSAEARDAYLAHDAHKAAGARLVAALQGGTDGLMVFDIALEPEGQTYPPAPSQLS